MDVDYLDNSYFDELLRNGTPVTIEGDVRRKLEVKTF